MEKTAAFSDDQACGLDVGGKSESRACREMWKFIASADAYYLIPFQDKAEQCHDQNAHAVVYWRRPARQYRCSNCPSQGALIYTMKFLKTFWPSTWRLVVFFWDRRGLLNKPVAIWFLTVIAVGLFGAMFDDMSRCRVEARQALIDYNHLITEFTDRRIALSEIILSAKTLDELKSPEVLEKWKMHFTFSEFQGHTLKDIESAVRRIPLQGNLLANSYWMDFDDFKDIYGVNNFFDFIRPNFSGVTQENFVALKNQAEKFLERDKFTALRTSYSELVPACGIGSAFTRVTFGWPNSVGHIRLSKFGSAVIHWEGARNGPIDKYNDAEKRASSSER